LAAACLALGACGSGDGFQPAAGGGGLQATFDSIQANVFTPICEQCHSGAGAPFGLRLDAANSYALLVGIQSGQNSAFLRVEPNDPAASYLIRKLEGTAGTGERMPAGLPPLPQADIDVIRQWITDGALPGGQVPAGPVRVTSLSPAPSSVANVLPSSITATFDRDANAPSVTTATFTLDRSGGDGTFGNGNDVAIAPSAVTVPLANPRTAVMQLAGVTSVTDTYRVTLVGTGPATILDLGGNALDGEFAGTFPSGNGTAGGNFQAQFQIAGTQPTLQSIQDTVFTPICSGCHTGGGANLPQSMNLTTVSASFTSLVNTQSVQVPALSRVAPSNPDDSYLIRKLEGGPNIVGDRMPRFGTPLDQPTINAIRLWITNGAAQ
jgi:hypothetical protein